jgi:hypothetical protein
MKKTAKQVQSDIIALLKGSPLAAAITGKVYRNGLRPRDSAKEDLIVIFTTGVPSQIQTGVVTLNLYVPDIDPFANSVFVEDGQRCEVLEQACEAWVENLPAAKSNYRFRLTQTIYTEAEPEIKQHFVVVKLQYQLFE